MSRVRIRVWLTLASIVLVSPLVWVVTGSTGRGNSRPATRAGWVERDASGGRHHAISPAVAERSREPMRDEAVGAPAAEAREAVEIERGCGALIVYVDQLEGGAARPDVRIVAQTDGIRQGRRVVLHTPLSRGSVRDVLLTGSLGRATFDLEAGKRIRLQAWDEGTGAGYREIEVAPLAPNESREMVIVWSRPPEREIRGVVLDRKSARPLRGAHVSLKERGRTLDDRWTGSDGSFRFETDSWREVYVLIERHGATPHLEWAGDDPLEISLRETSLVRVDVVDREGPAVGVAVELTADAAAMCLNKVDSTGADSGPREFDSAWEWFSWSATTGPKGRCWITSVASDTELTAHIVAPGREANLASITVAPAEQGSLELVRKRRGVLRVRLVDRDGLPVRWKDFWIMSAPSNAGRRFFACSDAADVQRFRTSARGVLEESLWQGTYLVGPSPTCTRSSNAQRVAPVAVPIHVVGEEVREVQLVVDRDVVLHGEVVDAMGDPVADAGVFVRSTEYGLIAQAVSGPYGRFATEPLAEGEYELDAFAFVPDRAVAKTRRVRVGKKTKATGVEIVLKPLRGEIHGFVVEPEHRRGIEATVTARMLPRGLPWLGRAANENGLRFRDVLGEVETRSNPVTGAFHLRELVAGEYALTVSGDALPGVPPFARTISLATNQTEVHDVFLELRPSAWLSFAPRPGLGAWRASYRIEFEGELFASGLVREIRTRKRELEVPAGTLSLRFVDERRRSEWRATVTLALDEKAVIEY